MPRLQPAGHAGALRDAERADGVRSVRGGAGMTDYSEPLANMAATLARLSNELNEREYRAALARVDDVLRRMQVVRDWLIVEVTRGGEE